VSRLRAYAWPGNERELENVVERAAVIAQGHRLDLERALREAPSSALPAPPPEPSSAPIRRADEMLALERENLLRALQVCEWRVSGEGGAAQLLGLPASTLSSRMKALGIKRP
jgi:transcriptional regulator of acetoin/glycerol metabolism